MAPKVRAPSPPRKLPLAPRELAGPELEGPPELAGPELEGPPELAGPELEGPPSPPRLDCRGLPMPPWWSSPCEGCYSPTCAPFRPLRAGTVDLVARGERP